MVGAGGGMIRSVPQESRQSHIVARYNTEIVKVLQLPDVRSRLVELGLQPVGNSVEEFARVSRSEYDKWSRIAKANNIRIDT